MIRHHLNAAAGPSGHWGWCSGCEWEVGPEPTRDDLTDAYVAHLDDALNQTVPDHWDEVYDPDEWGLTREEVLGCR